MLRISVLIPAHNEAALLPRSLAAVQVAAERMDGGDVEVVVVDNRSSDATAAIAEAAGATVVRSHARNLAAVRNRGAAACTGEVIVTIDADSVMAPNALVDVERHLLVARCVGGGARVVPERTSVGIRATLLVVEFATWLTGVSGAMFWCRRADFEAIGGFDERRVLGEDIDFARRLRAHGRRTGRKFVKLRDAPVVISMRKFDRFGDWHMFAMALQLREIRAAYRGTDTSWADRYFFDYNE